jgi:predicted amidohydrolase YtcJ
MKQNADLIIYNAKIYTVNSDFQIVEAMAVADGKILALGSDDEILTDYSAQNQLDLNKKIVYPGFIDAHCHFYGYGENLYRRADLKETGSFDEVLQRLKEYHKTHPTEWVMGRGWDQNDWPGQNYPSIAELDKNFPDHPVYLIRIDGHAALVNTEALKRAGIDENTKIEGGEIMLQNGLLVDNAMELVRGKIPEFEEHLKGDALQQAENNCFAVGLTSVMDAGLDKPTIDLIDSLQRSGKLKMRQDVMMSPEGEGFEEMLEAAPYKTDRLHVHSVKMYADGALGSRGAKMLSNYSDDPGNTGLVVNPMAFYRDICKKAYEKGLQVNTHAIGDSAVRLVLDVYAEQLKGKNDLRWRVEHAQIVHPDDFEKFGKYNIIPSMQPTHATSDMYWAEDRVGAERIKGAYALKDLLAQNGWIPLGTDFPIEDINPLYTFYAAVARKDLKQYPEEGFQMENALSREEALKGMTIWAAKASFEENEKGSLEPDKFADFVIFDKDIMEMPLDEVPALQVDQSWINGEKVYQK